jgi:hypothetical protein
VLLAADHPEDADRYSPMVSRLLHLVIIDILTTGVALRLGSATLRPMLSEIKKNLRLRRYVTGAVQRQQFGHAVEPRQVGQLGRCAGHLQRQCARTRGALRVQQQRDQRGVEVGSAEASTLQAGAGARPPACTAAPAASMAAAARPPVSDPCRRATLVA